MGRGGQSAQSQLFPVRQVKRGRRTKKVPETGQRQEGVRLDQGPAEETAITIKEKEPDPRGPTAPYFT